MIKTVVVIAGMISWMMYYAVPGAILFRIIPSDDALHLMASIWVFGPILALYAAMFMRGFDAGDAFSLPEWSRGISFTMLTFSILAWPFHALGGVLAGGMLLAENGSLFKAYNGDIVMLANSAAGIFYPLGAFLMIAFLLGHTQEA